jgi:hypothetical protein
LDPIQQEDDMQQGRFNHSRLAAIAIAGAALAARPIASHAQDHSTIIGRADLKPLNGSTARGQAELRLSADGHTLTVLIQASGLEPGGIHLSHIHGLSQNGQSVDSTCPTTAQDTDGDRYVELAEGAVKYGPILVDFMNVDPDTDGRVQFRKEFDISGTQSALPLQMRHVVIHGMTVSGAGAGTPGEVDGTSGYKTVLPVLCGEIRVNGNAGPLQFRKVK